MTATSWPARAGGAVLATVLAAVLAGALINQAIFHAWGLDFLRIASPSDVVMAGLPVLFGSLPGLAALAAGLCLWRGRGVFAILFCLVGIGVLYALVVRPAMAAAEHGFYGRQDWVIDGGTGGCAVAKVFWTGRDAVVYQCVATGPRRFRVSFDRGSMTLLPGAQVGELVYRM